MGGWIEKNEKATVCSFSPTDLEKKRRKEFEWIKKGGNERSGQNWISFEVIGKEMYSQFMLQFDLTKNIIWLKVTFVRGEKIIFSSLHSLPHLIHHQWLTGLNCLSDHLPTSTRSWWCCRGSHEAKKWGNNWRMQWETTFFPDLVTNRYFSPSP